MTHFSIHCHPVPIARANPLYSELDAECHYYPVPKTEQAKTVNLLANLEAVRALVQSNNKNKQPKPLPKDPNRITDSSSLNRSDLREINSYNYLLPISAQRQIQTVRRKVDLYPQRYTKHNYLSQSQILLLSPGWASAERYCCCSMPSPVNPSRACRIHRYCPYCSYLFGRDAQLHFVPSYNDANWHFLTGSYTGSLSIETASDCYEWLKYWDAYKTSLNQLLKLNKIRGYYLTEELAVTKLVQVQVLPHIHAIIDSDELGDETVNELGELVKTELKANSAQSMEPSIVVDPIYSQTNLLDHIQYMFKPINLVKAYETDWFNHCSSDRSLARRLNSNTTDVVMGYGLVNRRRPKMAYSGTLNIKCKEYIGKKTKDLHKYKDELRAIREASRTQYIEEPEVEEDLSMSFN